MELQLYNLKYVSLGIAIAGIILLSIITPESKYIQINQITKANIGEKITTIGTIKNLSISKNMAFFKLENNGTIKTAMLNPELDQLLLLENGKKIRVHGKISLYKGELEILANDVTLLEQ